MLLHVDRLPPWCSVAVLALAAWRASTALRGRPLPGRLPRLLIGSVLLVAVAVQFSTISGLAAGTSLLAGMGALKLLETRARRDYYVVLGVSLFLVVAACLDRQSLLRVPLYVGAIWLACAALAIVGTPHVQLGTRAAASLAGRSLGFALPIALALFLFFPRLQGQVWALPGAGSGVTGLSNEMSPGAISELSSSYEPAFRVRFFGRLPAARDMYWRGPVLQNFDGYTWRREPRSFYRQSPLRYLGDAYRYRVTLEPHQRNWWFALDTPTASPDRGVRLHLRLPARRAAPRHAAGQLRTELAHRHPRIRAALAPAATARAAAAPGPQRAQRRARPRAARRGTRRGGIRHGGAGAVP